MDGTFFDYDEADEMANVSSTRLQSQKRCREYLKSKIKNYMNEQWWPLENCLSVQILTYNFLSFYVTPTVITEFVSFDKHHRNIFITIKTHDVEQNNFMSSPRQ